MVLIVFFVILGLIVGVFALLWGWTAYLEESKTPQVRQCLYLFLFINLVMEAVLYYTDVIKPWMTYTTVLCGVWGMYDAIVRYPVVHDLDSFFTMKQVLIVSVKTMAYAVGFRHVSKNAGWFLLALFGNVWLVPLLYLMALPIGDVKMQNMKTDVVDKDLLFRVFELRHKEVRTQYCRNVQRVMKWALVGSAKCFPPLAALLRRFPTFRRLLRSGPEV